MSNPLNYANYDFEATVLELQNRLKLRGSWKDIGVSGTGKTLIELLAYIQTTGMYYTERRATESYLPTARNVSSVRNLVALLGYSPKRKTSAVGTLTFSIASPMLKIVYIPKYTVCLSSTGISYLTNEDAAIEKGQTSVEVNAIQGESARLEVSANGAANQEYLINSQLVENSANEANPTLNVLVDGFKWTKVDSFINSDSDSRHYRVINEIDGTVTIRFGDNVNGLAPAVGSTIIIQYVKSAGLDGVVANTGVITSLNSTIYDEDGEIVTVTVTNSTSFLGGDDEEGIEEIRYEAPRVFAAGQRAVTKADFAAILENYPGIANAHVWGEREEASLLGVDSVESMRGVVRICIILQEWESPDDAFKLTLSEFMYDNHAEMTTRYEFIDPVVLDVIPTLTIKVTRGHSLSYAQANVEEVIADSFLLGTTTRLGTVIKYSNVMSAIDALEDVSYVDMVFEIRKELSDSYDSSVDYGATLEATPVEPGSVRLFVDDTYAINDIDNGDGTGYFEMPSGEDYLINGTIDYTTGEVLLNIDPLPSSSIHVRYVQGYSDRNIVPGLRQIAKLYDVDVESIQIES